MMETMKMSSTNKRINVGDPPAGIYSVTKKACYIREES
jgi:hypothetical protein